MTAIESKLLRWYIKYVDRALHPTEEIVSLRGLIADVRDELATRDAEIAALRQRIKELEAKHEPPIEF